MIAFRHADPRFPFLWENSVQPQGRWNASGELTHYFCDTPDGAWAEFLRQEEIHDPDDLKTIRRTLWAVEIVEESFPQPDLPRETMTGGGETWAACQRMATVFRENYPGMSAPSAALRPGKACGWRVRGGLVPGPDRDGRMIAVFGRRPDITGWVAALDGRPDEELLAKVRHYDPR